MLAFFVWVCFSGCGKVNTLSEQATVQLGIDSNLIRNYVKSHNLKALPIIDQTTRLSTGEYYVIDTPGTGSALFTNATLITVSYSAKVMGGAKNFVNTDSLAKPIFHPSFTLGSVIKGWQLGLPKSLKGGTIRLFVPSGYAYGPYAQTNYMLDPNSILDFTIKLYDITN